MTRNCLLPILCLLSSGLIAQDCYDLVPISTDRFTGEAKIDMEGVIVRDSLTGREVIYGLFYKDGGLYVMIGVDRLGCVQDGAKLYFLFASGSSFATESVYEFNCDGLFVVDITPREGNLDFTSLLASERLQAIRFIGESEVHDQEIRARDAKHMARLMACGYVRYEEIEARK